MANTKNTPATTDHVDVVPATAGPLLADADMALIVRIGNGENVEGVDIAKLDRDVITGLEAAFVATAAGMRDIAGYMGAALALRTWSRVINPATNAPYESEVAFIEERLSHHPFVATAIRRDVIAAITDATDADGKRLTDRRMAELLGVGKSVVNTDRKAAAADTAGPKTGQDGDVDKRGPQTGGQATPDASAAKRYVTQLQSNSTRVKDAEAVMTEEQLLTVVAEARDILTTAVATLRLRFPDTELPTWVAALPIGNPLLTAPPVGPGKLRSGAEGTVATGPALKGAPVDPTAAPVTPATAARRRGSSKASA